MRYFWFFTYLFFSVASEAADDVRVSRASVKDIHFEILYDEVNSGDINTVLLENIRLVPSEAFGGISEFRFRRAHVTGANLCRKLGFLGLPSGTNVLEASRGISVPENQIAFILTNNKLANKDLKISLSNLSSLDFTPGIHSILCSKND